MSCTHSLEERQNIAIAPEFCPLCLHEEIIRLIAMNRELLLMVRQLQSVGRDQPELPPSDTPEEGDRG